MNAKRRWPRRLLIAVVALVALYAGYRYTLHRLVQAKLDEIRRAGYPVTLAELDKWYPQPPPGENAADVYAEAFKHYAGWQSKSIASPLASGDFTAILGDHPLSAEIERSIRDWIATNNAAIELMEKATAIQKCRFPISYGDSGLPLLAGVWRMQRLLVLRAVLEANDRQSQKATESLTIALRVSQALAKQPALQAQLLRLGCERSAFAVLPLLLAQGSVTDEQLDSLEASLGDAEVHESMTPAFIGQLCRGNDTFSQRVVVEGPAGEDNLWRVPWVFDFRSGARRRLIWAVHDVIGSIDIDHLHLLDLMWRFLQASQMETSHRLSAAQAITSNVKRLPSFCFVSLLFVPNHEDLFTAEITQIGRFRAGRAALAIERYRIAKGVHPTNFTNLSRRTSSPFPLTRSTASRSGTRS